MKKLLLPILAILLLATSALAAPQVVTETHTYILGDNDSKNDARAMCFLEAKRKMLEKAGTLVMSHTQADMGMLTKDEINSYTAALIKVESSGEKWRFNESGSMAVTMTVRAVLDYDDIQKRLGEIQKDSAAKKEIIKQQKRLEKLEKIVFALQQKRSTYPSSKKSDKTQHQKSSAGNHEFYKLVEKAESGDMESQLSLGQLLMTIYNELKDGVPEYVRTRLLRNAFVNFHKAATQGNVQAKVQLGTMLLEGNGVEQNMEEAFAWYYEAAQAGDSGAQFAVGYMFKFGYGVPKDIKKSIYWLMESAVQGDPRGQCELGGILLTKNSEYYDSEFGCNWLKQSAEQGYAKAQYMLACMYFIGDGVKQDNSSSYYWSFIAYSQGVNEALSSMEIAKRYMTPAQIAQAQQMARDWISKHQK